MIVYDVQASAAEAAALTNLTQVPEPVTAISTVTTKLAGDEEIATAVAGNVTTSEEAFTADTLTVIHTDDDHSQHHMAGEAQPFTANETTDTGVTLEVPTPAPSSNGVATLRPSTLSSLWPITMSLFVGGIGVYATTTTSSPSSTEAVPTATKSASAFKTTTVATTTATTTATTMEVLPVGATPETSPATTVTVPVAVNFEAISSPSSTETANAVMVLRTTEPASASASVTPVTVPPATSAATLVPVTHKVIFHDIIPSFTTEKTTLPTSNVTQAVDPAQRESSTAATLVLNEDAVTPPEHATTATTTTPLNVTLSSTVKSTVESVTGSHDAAAAEGAPLENVVASTVTTEIPARNATMVFSSTVADGPSDVNGTGAPFATTKSLTSAVPNVTEDLAIAVTTSRPVAPISGDVTTHRPPENALSIPLVSGGAAVGAENTSATTVRPAGDATSSTPTRGDDILVTATVDMNDVRAGLTIAATAAAASAERLEEAESAVVTTTVNGTLPGADLAGSKQENATINITAARDAVTESLEPTDALAGHSTQCTFPANWFTISVLEKTST